MPFLVLTIFKRADKIGQKFKYYVKLVSPIGQKKYFTYFNCYTLRNPKASRKTTGKRDKSSDFSFMLCGKKSIACFLRKLSRRIFLMIQNICDPKSVICSKIFKTKIIWFLKLLVMSRKEFLNFWNCYIKIIRYF